MIKIFRTHFILYVSDQNKSKDFYSKLFELQPRLHVQGMTEFEITQDLILGLMPEKGIRKLLKDSISDPEKSNGISRCELYLIVENPQKLHLRAIELGAVELSKFGKRDWGHSVAYSKDFDGNVLAFASDL